MTLKGLISAKDIFHGNTLKAQDSIDKIKRHQRLTNEDINSTEAAKVLLGSENVNPKKLKGAAEYLKKYWQQQKQRN